MHTPTPENLPGADHGDTVADSDGLAADVPAGGAGADSGAVAATEIDTDDDARVQNVSSQNDLPGVGTRAADGGMERGTDDARGGSDSTSRHHEDTTAEEPVNGTEPEPHVYGDDPIAKYQPGVGRDSAASSRIAQNLPDPDDA
ncbi:hypothetical protein NS206_12545 [Microbacterium testaceum]|uniref:hypothetical protein n=1 Tax=Microbacterium testaceum TaxID=2033 RepID=UPI0007343C91|nr:hypothetical protein [Microbacterium testaceum]KTS59778.1 hypothetical protein NS206_12545 [Microbacterium testaceum]